MATAAHDEHRHEEEKLTTTSNPPNCAEKRTGPAVSLRTKRSPNHLPRVLAAERCEFASLRHSITPSCSGRGGKPTSAYESRAEPLDAAGPHYERVKEPLGGHHARR